MGGALHAGSQHTKQPHPHAPDTAETAGGQLVLVVEDERHTRNALGRFLRRHGWNVAGFGTASEAQAWLEESQARQPVAGAVIDVHLPDGDGIDLTRELRRLLGEHIPIVIVSGDTSMDTLRRLRDAGGSRFVGKPMSLAALREALAPPKGGEARMTKPE